ncbi:hypothetical protein O3M35_006758 [Rhynocoris fuscipes]|uniref:RNase H type-1 domain-containing protein n=1 Tax=Rhynocoris fuscipes TaxID=488301 RepID=A0AAW1DKK1_9HEMI
MVWVRAHAGIEGNSRVDWFAKKATQLGEPLEVKIPYSDVIGTYKQKAIANWQKIYLSGEHAHVSDLKLWKPEDDMEEEGDEQHEEELILAEERLAAEEEEEGAEEADVDALLAMGRVRRKPAYFKDYI